MAISISKMRSLVNVSKQRRNVNVSSMGGSERCCGHGCVYTNLEHAKQMGESQHTPTKEVDLRWENDDPDLYFLYAYEGTKWVELGVCIQQSVLR